MPTTIKSFLRAAAGYIFLYMALMIVAGFVLVQVGEAVSFLMNLTVANVVVFVALGALVSFVVYKATGPDAENAVGF
jgi:biotin transporter BioY